MPELPEVETIVREVGPRIVGHRITGVEVRWERSLLARQRIPVGADGSVRPRGGAGATPTIREFTNALLRRKIEGVSRRAKYIVIDLSEGDKLIVHLAMTGRLLVRPSGAPEDRFTRVVIALDGDLEMRFADARKFGRVRLYTPEEFAELDRQLGPEPLSQNFTLDRFREMIGRKGTRIKPLLLDQRFIAGLGNIYADEALFEASIHPFRPAHSLSDEEIERLYYAIRQVLTSGIRDRGTTFNSYVDAFGRAGRHQFNLSVYRKAGQLCPRCGTPIERQVIAGRSAHFCPRCQPLPIAPVSRSGPASRKAQ